MRPLHHPATKGGSIPGLNSAIGTRTVTSAVPVAVRQKQRQRVNGSDVFIPDGFTCPMSSSIPFTIPE